MTDFIQELIDLTLNAVARKKISQLEASRIIDRLKKLST